MAKLPEIVLSDHFRAFNSRFRNNKAHRPFDLLFMHTHMYTSPLAMEHQYEYSSRNPSISFQESVVCHKDLVWPPRFYSCSFCTREFRSSQALGGHMNVHRRDRAKLNQRFYSPTTSSPPHHSSRMQKDSAMSLFRDIGFRGDLQMLPSFVSADEHLLPKALSKDRELLHHETVVSRKRIRKSDRNSPCLRREPFTNRKSISGSMEDVDLELRLGSNPTIGFSQVEKWVS